jgi:integrase
VTFSSFVEDWLADYPLRKRLKRSTIEGYEAIIATHLIPAFGALALNEVDVDRIGRYISSKIRAGLAGRTVNRHLNVLSLILGTAAKPQWRLIPANPVAFIDRPRETETEWRILAPDEIRAVAAAWAVYADEADVASEERAWRESARVVFLTVAETSLRRGEVMGLRWRAVSLADPEGAFLRVSETIVRGASDTPKSKEGRRTHPLSSELAAELFDHRARSGYDGDDDLVFPSPHRGSPLNPKRYAATFRDVLAKSGIEGYVRPFHDGRHSSITNAARAGRSEIALMVLAGHSDFRTTRRYLHLAGEMFRGEARRASVALWGADGADHDHDGSPTERRNALGEEVERGIVVDSHGQ